VVWEDGGCKAPSYPIAALPGLAGGPIIRISIMNRSDLHQRLPEIVDTLVKSVHEQKGMTHVSRVFLPTRDTIIEIIKKLRQLVYPGYFGKQGLTPQNLQYRIGELVLELSDQLFEQVRCCLRYREQIPELNGTTASCDDCDKRAAEIVSEFFDRIPSVRGVLAMDVQAAFESDPAAQSTDETIFCYPGIFAITIQRLAHEVRKLGVPLMPRIMTEYAHSITGIDIHPGATLGKSFFIDHGTGVVIGETTEIGERVKIYQGVTLGAVAPAYGQMLRGEKRHPTIEDDVIIYAGATILGGDTRIGRGSIINGNVFLTKSIPEGMIVSAEPPELKYRQRKGKPMAR
jgi:serine O-acetyltransferase